MFGMEEESDFCEVDLIGHCTFCRRKFVDRDDGLSSRKGEGGRRKGTDGGVPEAVNVPPSLESFGHLWSYLVKDGGTVGRFRFWRLSKLQEIPPMCQCCGEKIEELDNLHQKLMLKVGEIKRIILESTLGGVFSWRNEELEKKMENSALEPFLKMSTFQFLNKLQESSMPLQSLYGHGDNAADSENLFDDWNAEGVREMLALTTETDPLDIGGESEGEEANYEIKEEADSSASSDPDDNLDEDDKDADPVSMKFLTEGEEITANNQSTNQVSPGSSDAISSSEEDEDSSFNCDAQGTGESDSDYDNLSSSSEARKNSSSRSEKKSLKRPHKKLKSNDTRRTEARVIKSPQAKGKRPRKITLKPGTTRASQSFKCDLCEGAYGTEKRLTFHKIKDHGADPSPLNCKHCNRACSNFYVLAAHEKTHLEKGEFKCDRENCDKSYSNKHSLRGHIFRFHKQKGKHVCPTCGKCLIGTSGLKKHVDSVHLKIKHKCPEPGCEALLADPYSLSLHLLTHKAPSNICPVCGKSLRYKRSFANHLKSHSRDPRDKPRAAHGMRTTRKRKPNPSGSKVREYKCKLPDCGKQFLSMKDYLDHKKATNHDNENWKKFVCDTCGKAFSAALTLQYHNETAHLGLSIICEICGESFGSTSGLNQHRRIHSGARPYECPMCKQRFRQRSHLNYHMRCHERLGEQFQLRGSREHKRKQRKIK